MRANNRINLKWVRGNDVLLKCTLLEPQYNSAGEPIKDEKGNLVWIPLAIDTYDDLTVGLKLMGNTSSKSSSCCCNNDTATADYYSVVSYRGTEEGVLIVNVPGTLPTGTYSLEVIGHKNGRSMRAFEGMLFEIVECNGRANVTFDIQEGQKSCDVDIKVQLVSSAVSQGKNAFELWREIPGNENKTLQDYLDGIVSGESVQSDWNVTDGNSPAFIKNKPDIYTKPEVDNKIQEAVDGITPSTPSGNYYVKPTLGIPKSDLASTVQTSLSKADSAVQVEKDPTVPSWAKQPSKPTYQASEVGALSSATTFKSGNTSATGVSGNIQFKTINGNSIIGSGNIEVEGGETTVSGNKIFYYSNDDYNVVYDSDAAITSFDGFLTESIYNAVFQSYSGGLVYRLSRVKYYEGYEAALNKINQLVFTAYWISTNSIIKRDFYISRTYENDPYDYSVVSVDTPIASFNTTTQTLDIETTSSSTIPVPAEETWERWIDDGTICVGYNKHVKQKKQISNDGGTTWTDVSPTVTQAGNLIEANSTECGYTPGGEESDDYVSQYFTIKSLEDNNVISWKDLDEYQMSPITIYVSTNNGDTWNSYTSSPGGTVLGTLNTGDKMLIKGNSNLYGNKSFVSTKRFNVQGNIMSLIGGDNYSNLTSLTSPNTFDSLFMDCINLVSAENLILPAVELIEYCYLMMFSGCTSLTTAPVLPATTLTEACYSYMFNGCTSLNYIKMMATDISASNCLDKWTKGVASTGTFIKNSAAAWNVSGNSGIPEGWTVQIASA